MAGARGRTADPRPRPITGTSAAAAEVAAIALRLRVDRPELGPRAVHSLLVQAARPLPGVPAARQGAGVAVPPAGGALRIEPPIVPAGTRAGTAVAEVTLTDLAGGGGPYTISFEDGNGETALRAGVALAPGGHRRVRLALPAADGHLVVRDEDGAALARTPVVARRPARPVADALGVPEVRADAALVEVRVRLGLLRRQGARLRGARVHGVRLTLLPAAGGAPLPVGGAKQGGVVARRDLPLPRLAAPRVGSRRTVRPLPPARLGGRPRRHARAARERPVPHRLTGGRAPRTARLRYETHLRTAPRAP